MISKNESDTRMLGQECGKKCQAGEVIALNGPLGAGKTLFVRGLAEGLGIPPSAPVNSPTFILIQEYLGGRLPLYHIDFYRIEKNQEIATLGLEEIGRA